MASHRYTAEEKQKAIEEAASTNRPVLLAEWFEGWKGHEREIKLWAMPDGSLQEKAVTETTTEK